MIVSGKIHAGFVSSVFFLCKNTGKGGGTMKSWVERLVRCGIPEKTAEKIIDYLYRNKRTIELVAYVRMTEEAAGK